MSRFVKKALEKAPRLDKPQLEALLAQVVDEHQLHCRRRSTLRCRPAWSCWIRAIACCSTTGRPNSCSPSLPGSDAGEKPVWLQVRDSDVALFLRQAPRV